MLRRFKRYLWQEPNPLVQTFYLVLVVGGYGAFFLTGLSHLPNAFLGESHSILSLLVVATALHSFLSVSTTPAGILYTKFHNVFANYDYDGVLYTRRDCDTCKTIKIPRSKHCTVCNTCVPRFDHHCVWINDCVGERNHAQFLYFLAANVILCGYGSYVIGFILYDEFVRLQDEEFIDSQGQFVVGDSTIVLRYLVHAEAPLVILSVVCSLLGIAVLAFFLFHCYLVASNLTTNEFFKRRALRNLSLRPSHRDDPTQTPLRTRHFYDLGSVWKNVKEVFSPRCEAVIRQRLRAKKHVKTT